MQRSSGILLHVTSLPGPYGVGDIGREALAFVDFLADAGQSYWQVLPLGPTSYGNSPYQCLSSFAGNPLLISPEWLIQRGWLQPSALVDLPEFDQSRTDYDRARELKAKFLTAAHTGFKASSSAQDREAFEQFRQRQSFWLEDFACFLSLKEEHAGKAWPDWSRLLAARDPGAVEHWKHSHSNDIDFHCFTQFVFDLQWSELRAHARECGVRLIGDLPIFVAHDSADVWSARELFMLDDNGWPEVVAGVPPDYFSETGQRWGNPLYRWDLMAADGFQWWRERLSALLHWVDVARIDHFRGFEQYWEIPASSETAIEGRWRDGPGLEFFQTLHQDLGPLPLIAEDLGSLTEAVHQLRRDCAFPGMSILQFAFSAGRANPYLPHNHRSDTVAYSGTHDNDTSRGWFCSASPEDRQRLTDYLQREVFEETAAIELIRMAWASVADLAIIPLQDLLNLGGESRMNIPGTPEGNWEWRASPGCLTPERSQWLAEITRIFGRDK